MIPTGVLVTISALIAIVFLAGYIIFLDTKIEQLQGYIARIERELETYRRN